MASVFVGLAKGVDGSNAADFIVGAVSNAAATLELRIDNLANYRVTEFDWGVEQIRRHVLNAQQRVADGINLNG
jgi:hypothetical protein